MQLLQAGLLLSCAVLTVHAADVVCGAGRTKKTVTLKAGESANFFTSAPGTDYKKNVKCQAVFKRAKKNKCELNFSCEAFSLTAANAKCKGRSDFFTVSTVKKTRFCKATPDTSTKKGKITVNFISNKRSRGGPGAVCTATCLVPGATTSAPPASTDAPPATTAAPTPVTGATAPPTTAGPITCEDDNENCASWAGGGECENNPGYMHVHCKNSCQRCPAPVICRDDNDNCESWAGVGECDKNPGYMLVHCKKSCDKCSDSSTWPTIPTIISTSTPPSTTYGCVGGIQTYPSTMPNSNYYNRLCTTSAGLRIVTAGLASDSSLERTAYIIEKVTANVDSQITTSMTNLNFRHALMAAYPKEKTTDIPEHSFLDPGYWDERARGLGATVHVPVGSGAEENVMCHANDRYLGEDITIHEFAHSIHLLGFAQVFPGFNSELSALYNAAKAGNFWGSSHYAMTNSIEYFAEGVQSYFNSNTANSPTAQQLKTRDPNLNSFLVRYFGDNPWSRVCP